MKVGPNAQAIIDHLKDRPAAIIAAQVDEVQATFGALFEGAVSPARFDGRGALDCAHEAANAGWPACWNVLEQLDLVVYRIETLPSRKVLMPNTMSWNAHGALYWEITAKGWEVRMDDIAWLMEFRAAQMSDEATKQ